MSEILSVESLSKKFVLERSRKTTLKDSLIRYMKGQDSNRKVIWALREISFKLQKGQALGVIGHNGAGKTTLLRLICGVGCPTSGRISRLGHTSGLLELGTGFHPYLTGRENLLTVGILSGLSARQVKEMQKEIIEFAELEEFIDQPVRAYSSGMYLRLAFSAAIQFNPDVLVIDEVLTVGDIRFRQKCMDRIEAFRKAGKTLILTSHDPNQIRNLCDEVLVLEEGHAVMMAAPEKAFQCYHDLLRQRTETRATELYGSPAQNQNTVERGIRTGTHEAAIEAVHIFNVGGKRTDCIHSGEGLTVEFEFSLRKPLPDLSLAMAVYSETDVKCFESVIPSVRTAFGSLTNIKRFRCHLPELPLLPGNYHIAVGLYPTNADYTYDHHWQMHPLIVLNGNPSPFYISGVVSVTPRWNVV